MDFKEWKEHLTAFLTEASCTEQDNRAVFKELQVVQWFNIMGVGLCVWVYTHVQTCIYGMRIWQDSVLDGSGTRSEKDPKTL